MVYFPSVSGLILPRGMQGIGPQHFNLQQPIINTQTNKKRYPCYSRCSYGNWIRQSFGERVKLREQKRNKKVLFYQVTAQTYFSPCHRVIDKSVCVCHLFKCYKFFCRRSNLTAVIHHKSMSTQSKSILCATTPL